MTDRGKELLRVLMPYRDLWERMDNRDVVRVAAGVEVLDQLEKLRIDFFPLPGPIDARSNYYRGRSALGI